MLLTFAFRLKKFPSVYELPISILLLGTLRSTSSFGPEGSSESVRATIAIGICCRGGFGTTFAVHVILRAFVAVYNELSNHYF